ncbi:MAG: response regulator, partial [Crocosphaera sp.]
MLSFDVTQNIPNPSLVHTHRILVVEDEDVIRDMIVLALEEEGYDMTAVSDGRTALNLLQKENSNHYTTETEFDLLILDLMLPQINGLDICRLLRYQGNIVPILILSAK